MISRLCLAILLFLSVVLLPACSTTRAVVDTVSAPVDYVAEVVSLERSKADFSYAGKYERYKDEPVQRMEPVFSVRPQTPPARRLTAVFLPFRMLQHTGNHDSHLGTELGRVFWQTWLKDRTMPVLAYYEDIVWQDANQGMAVARALGADLVVGGEVTYLYTSGTLGRTQLSLRIKVYDVTTREMVWSMEHAGLIDYHPIQDNIFFNQRSRLPDAPLAAVTMALAQDLAPPVRKWMGGKSATAEAAPQASDTPPSRTDGPQRVPSPAVRQGGLL